MTSLEELKEEIEADIKRVLGLEESSKRQGMYWEGVNRGYLMALTDYKSRVEELIEAEY